MENNKKCILCNNEKTIKCECIEYSGQMHNCPVCYGRGKRNCPICNDDSEI